VSQPGGAGQQRDLAAASRRGFGPGHLPYGVFAPRHAGITAARVGVRLGDEVVDVAALARLDHRDDESALFAADSLNPFLATGSGQWAQTREWLLDRVPAAPVQTRHPLTDVRVLMPIRVGDYVDFYASRLHAENAARILRPGTEPLTPNWLHQPIGYHGRAGTLAVSGTDVVRPHGQLPPDRPGGDPTFGPTARLDFEAELAFVLGGQTGPGVPVPIERAEQYLFGVALLNDWSARDVQAFEARPLGPFLGKSFATSLSGWVTPLAALSRVEPVPPARLPLPYLRASRPWTLDVALTVELNGHVLSRPCTRALYWTPAQMLAHLTANGARVRPGDLFATGTVSGPGPSDLGCLLELSAGGDRPVPVGGQERRWLQDGDTVTLRGTTAGADTSTVTLGPVAGTVRPAGRPDRFRARA